ncbi:MAG: hypothetical protein LJE95_14575 [Acidobacteria bacterium]|nr:hypothetical protein [Acidobacteriota bacterium]
MTVTVQCPLCGARFVGQESCPTGCPMAGGCHSYCCPSCHYRFVEESRLVNWLRRVMKGNQA